jgi:hypothetical protein
VGCPFRKTIIDQTFERRCVIAVLFSCLNLDVIDGLETTWDSTSGAFGFCF